MVSFSGDKEMLYRANFCLRTAIRVLKPILQFKARSADEVYDSVKTIDWSQFLTPQQTFAVDSVVFSPEFRHSKFVAYKVKDAIADQFRERAGQRPNVSVANPDIQLHIHISDYDATLALDSSGESLHRRGYRQEMVAAPLNEVLAAAILLMAGWHGQSDLIDPFCGSGTFCIEAALIARGIAPGVYRKGYAFERWPDFDADLLQQIYDDDSRERPFDHHIYGRDIDPKAVGIANRNVRSARLMQDITIEEADFTKTPLHQADTAPTAATGEPPLIVTNPPYGQRITSPDLIGLYKSIGQRLKREHQGGTAWVLSKEEECFEAIGLKPSLKVPLFNGSLECELRKYVLFAGRLDEHRAAGGRVKTDAERQQMAKQKFHRHRDDDDDTSRDDDNHHFNKFSRRDDERRDFRSRGEARRGDDRGDFRPRGEGRRGNGRDFRAKGNSRAERQEARRRFFGGGGDD
ncbi:MAG: RNA methyltransferase [Bacteroidaceae bacterium]|nr:RNA methyltransferase [Bacteroidaceae bacterium]